MRSGRIWATLWSLLKEWATVDGHNLIVSVRSRIHVYFLPVRLAGEQEKRQEKSYYEWQSHRFLKIISNLLIELVLLSHVLFVLLLSSSNSLLASFLVLFSKFVIGFIGILIVVPARPLIIALWISLPFVVRISFIVSSLLVTSVVVSPERVLIAPIVSLFIVLITLRRTRPTSRILIISLCFRVRENRVRLINLFKFGLMAFIMIRMILHS